LKSEPKNTVFQNTALADAKVIKEEKADASHATLPIACCVEITW
jgi:hypothetical protein